MRKLKIKSPNNRCKCLIDFANTEMEFQRDEECIIEDNAQRIKWKVMTNDGMSVLVPSVCFTLLAVDGDALNLSEQ